jgi:hypothetical protein
MDAATDEAIREPRSTVAQPSSGIGGDLDPSEGRVGGSSQVKRATWLIAALSLLLFLPLQHAHFKGTDELAMFEMTRSLFERGDLAVPAIRHTEVGREGRRYSYFMPGQAFLALPLYALATPLRAVLPDAATTAIAGPPNRRGVYTFGGELETTLVGLLAPITAAALVALFFRFQTDLGVSPKTAAVLSLLLAATTHTAVMSTYLLRHTTESFLLLGALMLFGRFARGAPLRTLVAGSALASLTPLFRVPASIAAPILAAYLLWVLRQRGAFSGGAERLAQLVAAVLLPLSLAALAYALVNNEKWGAWFASPMVAQQSRFDSPLWRGTLGLLLSPGSSVFAYSPLLVLAPAGLTALWRARRAETLVILGLFVTLVGFYAKFDGWSGLWSAPGPRYLYPLVPLLLLPVGLWIDGIGNAAKLRRVWILVGGLAAVGLWVQIVSIFVRWGSVPAIAGYPVLGPDQSDFLFRFGQSPIVVMSGLLLGGGPKDSWLLALSTGWGRTPGQPGAVIALLATWGVTLGWLGLRLQRTLRADSAPSGQAA